MMGMELRASTALPAAGQRSTVGRRGFLVTAIAAWLGGTFFPSRNSVLHAAEEKAVTSRQAQEEAAKAIPWSNLNEETHRKILSVIEHPTIYRRLPKKTIECDAELYLFLLRNPEIVVNMWQVMGVAAMTAQRTGPFTWNGNDGSGTKCDVELAYGTEEMHILYGDGFYEGPLFKRRITGRCVLLLRSGYEVGKDERSHVGNLLDVFLTIDNAGVDLIAKTLFPLVGTTADTNFAETAKFISRVSYTAEQNPPGLQRLAGKLTKVDDPVREQFSHVAAGVVERAALRSTSGATLSRAGDRTTSR